MSSKPKNPSAGPGSDTATDGAPDNLTKKASAHSSEHLSEHSSERSRDQSSDSATEQVALLRSQSLTTVVMAELERMILQRELAPDARINEQALAAKLGVSRGPIREACRTLQSSGLVESKPNRGFFVRVLSRQEAIDAYHARASVIAYAGMMLAPVITSTQISQLNALLDAMDAVVSGGEVGTYDPINLEFHDSILQMSGNQRLRQMYRELLREQHLFRHRGLAHGNNLTISNAEHRSIVESLEAGDAALAFTTMRDHVLSGLQRMLDADDAADQD